MPPKGSTADVVEVRVGSVSEFGNGMRQLIKAGQRNIAVYSHKGRYFAIDNACYHHGGPLLQGDIEDLGGHPCVICPWHSYRIALDTGEGLYWGISMPDGGGAPRQELKSKGQKQRCHRIEVRGDDIYCIVGSFDGAGDQQLESDHYATLPIANSEVPTGRPVKGGGNASIHSGLRSGDVFSGAAAGQQRQAFGNPDPVVVVRCIRVIPRCEGISSFVFEKVEGTMTKRLDPGMYVTLGLPIGPEGTTEHRTYTVTSVRSDSEGGWFAITVKQDNTGRGGSRWLHSAGDQLMTTPIVLSDAGGVFTIGKLRSRINARGGYLLTISAGIGITPIYASLNVFLNDQFTLSAGPPLHVVHVHVDREEGTVAFLDAFQTWDRLMASNNMESDPVTYRFAPFYTRSGSGRPSDDDWRRVVVESFPTNQIMVMLCGPTRFMQSVTNVLTSPAIGIPANFVTTEAFDF